MPTETAIVKLDRNERGQFVEGHSQPGPGNPHVRTVAAFRKKMLAAVAEGQTVTDAARAADVDRSWTYSLRREDADFAKDWEDAYDAGTDVVEAEAFRRGVKGVDRPVFQGGAQVGVVREYSDNLLTLLLKARRPDRYRENTRIEHAVHTPWSAGPIDYDAIKKKLRDRFAGELETTPNTAAEAAKETSHV